MSIEIKVIESRSDLKEYIFLPSKIYKNDSRWVPPLYTDEWAFHNPKQNKALEYCDTIRALALENGKAVGRIMGIVHHLYNTHHTEKTVRFFNLDCINNQEVANILIAFVEKWGKEKGMNKIIGPFGFSDKDPQGVQIEGFEYLPVLATPTNPAYLKTLIESKGYEKEIDCVSYQMIIEKELPPRYQKVYERTIRSNSVKLIEFKSKAQLKPYIIPVLQLMNEAYAHIFGFTALTEEEMKKFAAQYLPILDPEFVNVVINGEEQVVAFVIAMPDMSKGIQKAKGNILPFGFLYILNAMRKTNQLDLLLGAIKEKYRRAGINVLMAKAMMASAAKRKLNVMDSHLILENNLPMRGECEKLNGKVCKRYRVYSKTMKFKE
jgi:hypothetical protein